MSEALTKWLSKLEERKKETVVAPPLPSMQPDDVVLKVFIPGRDPTNVCVPQRCVCVVCGRVVWVCAVCITDNSVVFNLDNYRRLIIFLVQLYSKL